MISWCMGSQDDTTQSSFMSLMKNGFRIHIVFAATFSILIFGCQGSTGLLKTASVLPAEEKNSLVLAAHEVLAEGTKATGKLLYELTPSKETVGKLLQVTVTAAAIGLAAYYDAKYQAANTTSYYDSDDQGCCSWHGGIKRNIYGGKYCHPSGYLLCDDGELSPTCTCSVF